MTSLAIWITLSMTAVRLGIQQLIRSSQLYYVQALVHLVINYSFEHKLAKNREGMTRLH
jgi:hypothetical protein